MKNILVKNSLKSILMSVLILFVIPAARASSSTDCDENFKAGFYEGNKKKQNDNNNNDNANNNGNITNTNETTLGQPNERPESGKADGSNSKNKLFFTSLYDRSETERDKYFPLRQILLKRQNEKQQNEEQEKPWYTDYSHLFHNESQ